MAFLDMPTAWQAPPANSCIVSADVALLKKLSRRELQVLWLIGEGLTMKELAAQIGISAKTADTYRASISRKLHLPSKAAIIKFAIRAGLTNL